MAFLNVGQEHGNEGDVELRDTFQKIFLTALLLTGSAANAEGAILEGFSTLCKGELRGGDALLGATLKAAVAPDATIRRETSETVRAGLKRPQFTRFCS
jgi:hypothetical protein